jgi:hypothetical protein
MAALKSDLQGVLPHQAYVLEAKLFGSEAFDARQAAWRARLATTLGARASPAELLSGVAAAVPVLPHHVHHLAFAIDIDVDWKRVGVLQLARLPNVDHRQLPV